MPERLIVPWHVEECSDEHTENCPCIIAARLGDRVVYIADGETPELAARIVADHNALTLAREFRIPLRNELGGYMELSIVRESSASDRWAITDGSYSGLQAWVDGEWRYIGDVGRAAAYTHSLDEALALGNEVAGTAGRQHDDQIRALITEQEVTA